jgi:hypothetical protein
VSVYGRKTLGAKKIQCRSGRHTLLIKLIALMEQSRVIERDMLLLTASTKSHLQIGEQIKAELQAAGTDWICHRPVDRTQSPYIMSKPKIAMMHPSLSA